MDSTVCELQVCNLVFGKFDPAEYQKVNIDSKCDANDMNSKLFKNYSTNLDQNSILLNKLGI